MNTTEIEVLYDAVNDPANPGWVVRQATREEGYAGVEHETLATYGPDEGEQAKGYAIAAGRDKGCEVALVSNTAWHKFVLYDPAD
jgi:hypothetical protein